MTAPALDALLKIDDPLGADNRCKDFDEDCDEVSCKVACWLYAPEQGWCPFLKGIPYG